MMLCMKINKNVDKKKKIKHKSKKNLYTNDIYSAPFHVLNLLLILMLYTVTIN